MGCVGYTCLVISLKLIPMFIFIIIFNTVPFWSSILGYYVCGDKISRFEVCLMVGCFSGVVALALAKGGVFDFQNETSVQNENEIKISTSNYVYGMGSVLITSWMFSSITVITRKIRDLHFTLMMFHYGLFATILLWIVIILEYNLSNKRTYYPEGQVDCPTLRIFCYD